MHTRLVILSIVMLAALCVLTCLGYHAVTRWAQGLEGARRGDFVDVAEQIRRDVNRKLDAFIQAEEDRSYTDYLYYYVPEVPATTQQQLPVLLSPLAGQFANGLAYGYFQVEPTGQIVSPWQVPDQTQLAQAERQRNEFHFYNIKDNIVPLVTSGAGTLTVPQPDVSQTLAKGRPDDVQKGKAAPQESQERSPAQGRRGTGRSQSYTIESLQNVQNRSKVIEQQRSIVASNTAELNEAQTQQAAEAMVQQSQLGAREAPSRRVAPGPSEQSFGRQMAGGAPATASEGSQSADVAVQMEDQFAEPNLAETVQIRIDPFVPILVPEPNDGQSIFGSQVFLLRRVQIEDRHIVQGFQLNEAKLLEEVNASAETFMRDNMTFELCATEVGNGNGSEDDVAYTAILDFGFGDLLLDLKELDPLWIGRETRTLRTWYLSTISVVSIAVILALASFWHTTRAQVKLAQKKDDFISAVSHELRTPLTSIRMYAEMLENNWLKSKAKATEYYRNMRQESERLTRLVENVLDFSRLQRGRKRYDFRLGDINACITEVVAMMKPYAAQHGFSIETDLDSLGQSSFDRDAVAQIVVNLLDNAVKYAKSAEDKTITIRTRQADGSTMIEVEDHGPGVPHRHRKRIFEQFYRCDAPAPKQGSQTTGTGLGLALVKRFAEAHNGSVEVLAAKPRGIIFRVALANPL